MTKNEEKADVLNAFFVSVIIKTSSCSGELKNGSRIRMKPIYSQGKWLVFCYTSGGRQDPPKDTGGADKVLIEPFSIISQREGCD